MGGGVCHTALEAMCGKKEFQSWKITAGSWVMSVFSKQYTVRELTFAEL